MRFIGYHIRKVNKEQPKAVPSPVGWNPCLVKTLGQVAHLICNGNWSPGIFKHQYRKQANFMSADFVALDFDSGEVTIDEARSIWEGCSHIIGTTSSHTPAKHKFRVILTLEKRIKKSEDYKATVSSISKRYGADVSVADSARFFFPCREIVSISSGDLQEIIEPEIERQKFPVREPNTLVIPSKILRSLTYEVVPVGERNNWCYGVGADLSLAGYSFDDIMARVLASPTYQDGSPPVREIARAIKNGMNKTMEGRGGTEEKSTN